MEYNFFMKQCCDDDVISFGSELYKFSKFKPALESATEKVGDIIIESLDSQGIKFRGIKETSIYAAVFPDARVEKASRKWLCEGKDCEILRVGAKSWQKGKIRIKVTIEFCPDEPEIKETPAIDKLETSKPVSPLDDIRQMMKEENQQNIYEQNTPDSHSSRSEEICF